MDGDITGADLASAMTPSSDAGTTAPGSAASPETTTATMDPGATVPAAASATAGDRSTNQPKPTEPPPDKWPTILENARQKAIADWERDYGWAKQVKREDFTQAVEIAKRISADPIAHVTQLLAELQAHPQHSQTLKSLAAKALGSGRREETAPQPNVQITDAEGRVVGETYDAAGAAALVQFYVKQALAAQKAELAPVIKTHETLAEQQRKDHETAEGVKFATGLIAELKAYPHFEAHLKEIGAEVVRILSQYPETDPRLGEPAFLEAATLRAYHRVVTPTLDQSARQAALHDITTKAQHSGVTPGTGAAGAPKPLKDMSWEDGLKHEFARLTAGAR